jgi:hypothetical protein
MRMWLVNPSLMCRKHLLGEHVELHMMVGSIVREKSLKGFVDNGLIDVTKINDRHNELVNEMKKRGYNHKSPIHYVIVGKPGNIDIEANLKELARRCKECGKLIDGGN